MRKNLLKIVFLFIFGTLSMGSNCLWMADGQGKRLFPAQEYENLLAKFEPNFIALLETSESYSLFLEGFNLMLEEIRAQRKTQEDLSANLKPFVFFLIDQIFSDLWAKYANEINALPQGKSTLESCLELFELPPSKGTDRAAIRKSYRILALKYHPDKNRDNEEWAEAKFIEVRACCEISFEGAC